jgi:hypothetical protein
VLDGAINGRMFLAYVALRRIERVVKSLSFRECGNFLRPAGYA